MVQDVISCTMGIWQKTGTFIFLLIDHIFGPRSTCMPNIFILDLLFCVGSDHIMGKLSVSRIGSNGEIKVGIFSEKSAMTKVKSWLYILG